MNYIGSKHTLLPFLYETINKVIKDDKSIKNRFADLFAGTGVVGEYYRSQGYKVISNDIQFYSYVLNKHKIENDANVNIELFDHLNSLNGVEGFIYNNYCAGSNSNRNYFTDYNGKKCDAVRIEIERLKENGILDESSYYFYLASLIHSIDKYANTAAVYGAFLKHIKKTASKFFFLEPLPITSGPKGIVYNQDANVLIKQIEGDILYLDPPYNARQYWSNYHILETIAKYDNPTLRGKTGLRDAGNQKSDYCSKRTAANALEELIKNAKFKYIFLSYNNEGLLSLEQIRDILSKYGEYFVYTKEYKRFKSNNNTKRNRTFEHLHCLIKD